MNDARVAGLALTTLSLSNEGVFLVGRLHADLNNVGWSRHIIRLEDAAHMHIVLDDTYGVRNVYIEPIIGLSDLHVDTSNYTAYGYLSGELLEKYEAWEAARKEFASAVEEDVSSSG